MQNHHEKENSVGQGPAHRIHGNVLLSDRRSISLLQREGARSKEKEDRERNLKGQVIKKQELMDDLHGESRLVRPQARRMEKRSTEQTHGAKSGAEWLGFPRRIVNT